MVPAKRELKPQDSEEELKSAEKRRRIAALQLETRQMEMALEQTKPAPPKAKAKADPPDPAMQVFRQAPVLKPGTVQQKAASPAGSPTKGVHLQKHWLPA